MKFSLSTYRGIIVRIIRGWIGKIVISETFHSDAPFSLPRSACVLALFDELTLACAFHSYDLMYHADSHFMFINIKRCTCTTLYMYVNHECKKINEKDIHSWNLYCVVSKSKYVFTIISYNFYFLRCFFYLFIFINILRQCRYCSVPLPKLFQINRPQGDARVVSPPPPPEEMALPKKVSSCKCALSVGGWKRGRKEGCTEASCSSVVGGQYIVPTHIYIYILRWDRRCDL